MYVILKLNMIVFVIILYPFFTIPTIPTIIIY